MPSQGLEFLATSFCWQDSVTCKAETRDGASWLLVGLLPLEVSSSVAFCHVLTITREGASTCVAKVTVYIWPHPC